MHTRTHRQSRTKDTPISVDLYLFYPLELALNLITTPFKVNNWMRFSSSGLDSNNKIDLSHRFVYRSSHGQRSVVWFWVPLPLSPFKSAHIIVLEELKSSHLFLGPWKLTKKKIIRVQDRIFFKWCVPFDACTTVSVTVYFTRTLYLSFRLKIRYTDEVQRSTTSLLGLAGISTTPSITSKPWTLTPNMASKVFLGVVGSNAVTSSQSKKKSGFT